MQLLSLGTNPIRTTRNSERIKGSINDPLARYDIALRWDGQQLEGRLGGWWFAENLKLERRVHSLLGTVLSSAVRLAISAQVSSNQLEIRFSGSRHIERAVVYLGSDTFTGQVFQGDQSYPLEFRINHNKLEGAVHGGQNIRLEAGHVPDWILLTTAIIADAAQREVSKALLESLDSMGER
jgi:hypothetical protein